MHDELTRFQSELSALDGSLRAGDSAHAYEHLAVFDAELTRYVRGEELVLFPVLERFTAIPARMTEKLRREHGSMRRMVDMLWELLAREDQPRGLEVLSTGAITMKQVAVRRWNAGNVIRERFFHK